MQITVIDKSEDIATVIKVRNYKKPFAEAVGDFFNSLPPQFLQADVERVEPEWTLED